MDDKKKKVERPAKPIEKVIWFLISVVIAVVGYFLRTGDVVLSFPIKVVYCAFLLFTIIMAAQRTSEERMRFGKENESGKVVDKKKYIISSIIYYFFIVLAVFYCFFCLWVVRFISI